jgi:hypothetical protein
MYNVNLRKLSQRLFVLGVLTLCLLTQGSFGTRVNGTAVCCLETCCLDCSPNYLACKDDCDANHPNDPVARQYCKDQCLVQRNNCYRYCDPYC